MQTLCSRISERKASIICTDSNQSFLSEIDVADALRIRVRKGHLVRKQCLAGSASKLEISYASDPR